MAILITIVLFLENRRYMVNFLLVPGFVDDRRVNDVVKSH